MKTYLIVLPAIILLAAGCNTQPKTPITSNTSNQMSPQTSSTNTNNPPVENSTNWKTNNNIEYGFSFKFPDSWVPAGRSIKIKEFFTSFANGPEVFDIETISNSGSLEDTANVELKKNNCPSPTDGKDGDHTIKSNPFGVLFVEYCTAGSEVYNYVFKNKTNQTILFSYHDDFPSDATETVKLITFEQIIASISVK